MAAQRIFSLAELNQHISTEERALEFCRDKGLIPREAECPLCGDLLQLRGGRKFGRFVCQRSVAGDECPIYLVHLL